MAAVGFIGCGPQSSVPVAATPATNAAVTTLPKVEGPLVPATTNVAAEVPVAAPKPPGKPAADDSAPTRPKADREPTKPGDPEKITFDDLILGMQADMVYRPFMLTDRAKELEGKRVRLTGEMYGSVTGSEKLKEFIILRNKECKYGAGGQADHVADVKMKEGQTTKFIGGTIRVEGTIRIRPLNGSDGNTKHIYVLEDALMK